MSWRDIGRVVFGSSQPTRQPSVPSTRDLEKQRKQNAKEAAASAARRKKHRDRVLRGDV
ncbi:hypothetical protein OG272_16050 [Streptomyces sp. NBC_00104]|uniref:hypothetical protein n=1 Tax=Streptomyces sp. NBC_00104 TaxID=2903621 RepID=UPI003251C3C8